MSDNMKFKFISVLSLGSRAGNKGVYEIVNNRTGSSLGIIKWYCPWRQWTVEFGDDTVWSAGCLADVQAAMRQIAEAKR